MAGFAATSRIRMPARPPAPPRMRFGLPGMTFTEMVLALAVVAGVLGGLQMLSASLRADSADEQTRRTLRALQAAALLHHQLAQHGPMPPDAVAALRDGPTDAVLNALLTHPRTAAVLTPIRSAFTRAADGSLIVRDGYGRPIRYLPPAPGNRGDSGGIQGPGDFVSAGPDGRFGEAAPAERSAYTLGAADNLYGSDLEFPP